MRPRIVYTSAGFAAGFLAAVVLRVGSSPDELDAAPPPAGGEAAGVVSARPAGSPRKDGSGSIGADGLAAERFQKPAADEGRIDAFLRGHGYSKESLIAASLLSPEPARLREAAERFPDDPHIQLLVIGSEAFAGERSEWIARFKASQPDNALASLFLGGDLLAKGAVEEGLAELRRAASQERYHDFAAEGAMAMESALIEFGHPVLDAKLRSLPVHAIRHLQSLQGNLESLRVLASDAGDPETTAELATLGFALGNQLSQGEASRFGINRLVGFSIETTFLGMLDPDVVAPGFDRTPATLLAEVEAERSQLNADLRLNERLSELSEEQVIHFGDRIRTLGQPDAWNWLREQLGETE